MAVVKKEIFTREVEKGLSHADTATFLDGIPDRSQYVQAGDEAETIHSTYFGVKPDVLINNTTYPIAIQDLQGDDFTIQLDKFQTTATPITDDELYAAVYDKMANVKDAHVEAISEKKQDKAIHALAPSANTADTPVLLTTGPDDGTGRKRLIKDDIIRLKKEADDRKWPTKGRRLVLCNEHISDLLLVDQKFADQYYNYTTGKIANLYGFEVYEYVANPYFTVATKAKKSFGSVPGVGDRMASVAFVVSRARKAAGSTKMYWSKAEQDPLNQRNLVNFRHYFICLPSALKCIGAVVSDNAL
jgi:hypothetical protein